MKKLVMSSASSEGYSMAGKWASCRKFRPVLNIKTTFDESSGRKWILIPEMSYTTGI